MAAADKDLTEPAARNLSPGQLQSLFKMEPKTLGVSQEQMSQQLVAACFQHSLSQHHLQAQEKSV